MCDPPNSTPTESSISDAPIGRRLRSRPLSAPSAPTPSLSTDPPTLDNVDRSTQRERSDEDLAAQLAGHLVVAFPTWPVWRGGWPGEADAALVDAVFSTRAAYDSTVLPLVRRWRSARTARKLGHGVSALVLGGRDFVSETLDNRQYVPGRAKKLKVDAVLEVAERLLDPDVGLDTAQQITERALANRGEVRQILEGVKGVGPAQSAYFLMLLGVQGVKADTLVTHWVRQQLGGRKLTQHEIETVVAGAAERLGKNAIEVDHAIWRTESNRRRQRSRRSTIRQVFEPCE